MESERIENVEHRTDDHAVVGESRIDVTNWPRLCKRQVRVSWPSIGAVDLAAAKRFAADLQTAIEVAERFAERNERQNVCAQILKELDA
jgi:hypothetical protein